VTNCEVNNLGSKKPFSRILEQLLVVPILVEILPTVRISIRSHYLFTEPSMVVGLITSIRRILMITLQIATFTKGGAWSVEGASIFRASMMELGLWHRSS
jgi:uncharacterized membrane protein (DUF373 family)